MTRLCILYLIFLALVIADDNTTEVLAKQEQIYSKQANEMTELNDILTKIANLDNKVGKGVKVLEDRYDNNQLIQQGIQYSEKPTNKTSDTIIKNVQFARNNFNEIIMLYDKIIAEKEYDSGGTPIRLDEETQRENDAVATDEQHLIELQREKQNYENKDVLKDRIDEAEIDLTNLEKEKAINAMLTNGKEFNKGEAKDLKTTNIKKQQLSEKLKKMKELFDNWDKI